MTKTLTLSLHDMKDANYCLIILQINPYAPIKFTLIVFSCQMPFTMVFSVINMMLVKISHYFLIDEM